MVSLEKYAIFSKFETQTEKEKKFQRASGAAAAAAVRSPLINVYQINVPLWEFFMSSFVFHSHLITMYLGAEPGVALNTSAW